MYDYDYDYVPQNLAQKVYIEILVLVVTLFYKNYVTCWNCYSPGHSLIWRPGYWTVARLGMTSMRSLWLWPLLLQLCQRRSLRASPLEYSSWDWLGQGALGRWGRSGSKNFFLAPSGAQGVTMCVSQILKLILSACLSVLRLVYTSFILRRF